MAAIKTLERKIERHEKDSQDTINSIKSELRTLQSFRRPVRTDVKTAEVPKGIQPESARKATTKPMTKMKGDDKKLVSSCSDLRMSKRTNALNHPNDEELKNAKVCTSSVSSATSFASLFSDADSIMTKINVNGKATNINCNPLKLVRFLMNDLKTKLKNFVPEDDKEIPRALKEINYAITQAYLGQAINGSSANHPMENQTTQIGSKVANDKQFTSKEVQTNLHDDEVEKLRDFHDKYLENQLKLDVNLRQIEDMFALELSNSNEKIVKLNSEISLLQRKFSEGMSSAEQSMASRVDLKIEEIKGEIKFLSGVIEETRNRSVIDNMQEKLAQTNKKMIEVKKKCTAATQHCLRVQLESLIANTTSSKSNEIGHELGIIKSNFGREIAALKSTVSGNVARLQRHDMESSYASSSSTSSSSTRKTSSESIKSTIQWNEKMADIAFDDKFSTIIDDEMESGDDRRRLMTKAEIDNDASAYGRIRSAPSLMTLPQERSFN